MLAASKAAYVLGLLIAVTSVRAFAQATPPSSQNPAPTAEERVAALENEISFLKRAAGRGVTAAAIVFALASFFGYSLIRRRISQAVDRRIHNAVNTAVANELPQRIDQTLERAERELLRVATVMALSTHHEYEAALSEFGWNGEVSSLRTYSAPLRRTIIEALHSSRTNREENREAAWRALAELLEDNTSIETLRLFFRVCNSTRRYEDGLNVFQEHREAIARDADASLRAATVLRSLRRLEEAHNLAKPVIGDASWDLFAVNNVAGIQRDLGKFDEAHDLLRVSVDRILTSHLDQLPRGWSHLLNSFIANCIDRGNPQDGIRPGDFLLARSPDPVALATIGRLAVALPIEHPKRAEFTRSLEDLANRQPPGEAALRCRVALMQLRGTPDEAITLLESAIEEVGQPPSEPMREDVYYHRCTLGMLLADRGRIDDAINVLMRAASFNYGGEAKFCLAIVHAKQGDNAAAARWVREAIHELPKWAARARDHGVLRGVPEIAQELARLAQSVSP